MAITVYTATKFKILLDEKPLASAGGEGSVHRVIATPNYSNFCVKIYHQPKRTTARRNKVEFMIKNKPQNTVTQSYIICFPTELIFDASNKFVGFLMPLAFHGSEELYELTTSKISPRLAQQWSKFDRTSDVGFKKRLMVCVNIAVAVHSIHQTGKFAIVDYKPQNILITNDGKISITDVDSFQISENGNVLHHSEVATPEYAPPESVKLNPSSIFIPESWDRFSLAISFYEILYGIHPYTATCDGQYSNINTIGEKIQKGLFVHGSKKSYLTVIPPVHYDYSRLPVSIKQLFIQAFENGHTNPNARPSAEDWGNKIYEELKVQTSFKPNTISVTSKKPIYNIPSARTRRKSSPTLPTTGKQSTRVKRTTTQQIKEDYMIWKVFTVILAIAAIALYANLTTTQSTLSSFRNQQTTIESEKASLQSQLAQLQSSQSTNEYYLNTRIQDLQTNLDAVSQFLPLYITDVTFRNVETDGTVINSDASEFSKSYVKNIQPVIKFNSVTSSGARATIYYKIFDANNTLLSGLDSPFGYSYYREINIPSNYTKDNSETLNAYYMNCPFSCSSGDFTVEFWYDGIILKKSTFRIIE